MATYLGASSYVIECMLKLVQRETVGLCEAHYWKQLHAGRLDSV